MEIRKITPRDKVLRFRNRYPELFNKFKVDRNKLKEVYSQLSINDFKLISYKEDVMRYVAISLLMMNKEYESTLIMNAYSLLDIYLGKSEDYSSLLDIESRIVIIYLGYSEFENKRQSDVIEQLIEQQRVRGGKFWLLYKGTDIRERYPKLIPAIKSCEGDVTEIKSNEADNDCEVF